MVSAVQSRPNYYELLGLTPAASDDEITHAFSKAMGMFGFHPIGLAAHLGAAFETLRNPAKRRDYDRSIGLAKEPEPQPQAWALAAQRGGTPFFGLAALEPTAQRQPEARPAPRADPLHRPAAPSEPRVAPFIAAALRESPQPQPEADRRPEPKPEARIEPQIERNIEDILAAARATIPEDSEDRPGEWKRPAVVVGGLILAVGLVGGLAGISAGGDAADSQQNEARVTVAVPAAKTIASSESAAAPGHFEAVSQPRSVETAAARNVRHRPARQPRSFEKSALDGIEAAISQPETSPGVDAATEQAGAETAAPEAVPASLPLPNRVIARTIDRIGYSCGSVASATMVSEGVYKITCTSGQSYQAAPVHGRYHFRRLGRN